MKSTIASLLADFSSTRARSRSHAAEIAVSKAKTLRSVDTLKGFSLYVTYRDNPLESFKNIPRERHETVLAGAFTYNTICKDRTPKVSESSLAIMAMLAKAGGVNISDRETQERVKRVGRMLLLHHAAGTLPNDYCADIYASISRLEGKIF